MTTRTMTAVFTLVLAAAATAPAPAHGIPAFARKYNVSCNLCHSPAPRLNEFGETFAANGFEFAPGEQPRDTIDTGDAMLRLLRRIDLAFRLDAFVAAVRPRGADDTTVDLQTPWNIKVLSGGAIADRISYYLYFFMSERGEVAGLEDAYIQFTDIAGTGVSVMAGQFQVSDPLLKRELRLHYEDYQPYRVRVGHVRADLTYDRGLFASWSPWEGGDVAFIVVNGSGLDHATAERLYDRDAMKNVALRVSHDLGFVRVGGFGYLGRERAEGFSDRIIVWGPDATFALLPAVELNVQFLRREDTNPLLTADGASSTVDSGLAELIIGPLGADGRWFATGLFNWIEADQPVVSLRLGEQDEGFLRRYRTAALGAHYLLHRNVRLMGEIGYDMEVERPRFTLGSTLAW